MSLDMRNSTRQYNGQAHAKNQKCSLSGWLTKRWLVGLVCPERGEALHSREFDLSF